MLQQAKEVMQTTAWNLANGKTCRLDTGALGRLRLMLAEADSLQDLRNRVKSIKTKNKREGADTLLKSLPMRCICQQIIVIANLDVGFHGIAQILLVAAI